jgi:hypothetical protein
LERLKSFGWVKLIPYIYSLNFLFLIF